MTKFKHLANDTTKLKLFNKKKLKSWLNLGNVCYHSVQNLSTSHLLSKNVLHSCILWGCESWSFALTRAASQWKTSNLDLVLQCLSGPHSDFVAKTLYTIILICQIFPKQTRGGSLYFTSSYIFVYKIIVLLLFLITYKLKTMVYSADAWFISWPEHITLTYFL